MANLSALSRLHTKPSEPHLKCLRDHIALCNARDKLLTAVISIAQTDGRPLRKERLLGLHRLRITCRREAQTCRSAIAPITWIPNEILAEIFVHCLPRNHHLSRCTAPLLFLQVCALWRNVALSTRSLWNSMAFWTPPTNTDLICYPIRFLNDWILHAGRKPLDLFFEQGLVYNHMKLLVELVLLVHYPQCRHLDIHLTKASALSLVNFVTLPPGSLRNLETLVLEGLDEADFAFEGEGSMITVFRDSPRLQKFTTDALEFTFRFNDDDASIPIFDINVLPWAQLTHLMITDFIRVDVFVVTLAQCAALHFLRVSLDLSDNDTYPNMDEWLPKNPVLLSSLTELRLSVSDGFCMPMLMDVFSFPALHHLHFQRSETEPSSNPDIFSWTNSQNFLRQICNVHILSLAGRLGTAEEILVLLHSTQQVTNLTLDIWTDYQFLIPKLFPLVDTVSSEDFVSRPLQLMTHLGFRLEGRDLPFPSHCIRDAVNAVQWPLSQLTVIVHRAYRQQFRKICDDFAFSPLQIKFGIPRGPIRRSTRFGKDESLIRNLETNVDYTMFDRSVVTYNS